MRTYDDAMENWTGIYGNDPIPVEALIESLLTAFDMIDAVAGPKQADRAFDSSVGPLLLAQLSDGHDGAALSRRDIQRPLFAYDWRDGELTDLTGVDQLVELHAYTHGGLIGGAVSGTGPVEDRARAHADLVIGQAATLLALCARPGVADPGWRHLLEAAKARRALDHGEGEITPLGLATVCRVTEKTVRNLAADDRSPLRIENGTIPLHLARDYAQGRMAESAWRLLEGPGSGPEERTSMATPEEMFVVPLAVTDQEPFLPWKGLDGTYTVGPKGEEVQVKGYRAALAALAAMPRPYWRRPSPTSQVPGIKAGSAAWQQMSLTELMARMRSGV